MLLDVLGADPTFGLASKQALSECLRDGKVVASDIVWAETTAWFPTAAQAQETLARLAIAFSPLEAGTSAAAGAAWSAYRRDGGRRERVVADFLVAAHASAQADRLLTRDRGFYRLRFAELRIVDPADA